MAGMAKELFAPVMMIVPAIVLASRGGGVRV